VGLIGLNMEQFRPMFLSLSFLNLLLTFSILVFVRKNKNQLFYTFLFICFLVGMTAEWIGVHTGLLFGNYYYADNLGFKIGDVPIIIGFNWGILTVLSCSLSRFLTDKWHYKILLSLLLMTFLDFLIEPVAINSGYWIWIGNSIPLYNYVCWFLIALPLHYLYYKWKLDEQNFVNIVIFVVMTLFFLIQNII
jgi:bisanhydrobacterioruberin hydratase